MTPAELKTARRTFGLSAEGFARLVRVRGGGRNVRRWEDGSQDIPGPVQVIVELLQRFPEAFRWLRGVTDNREGK